LIWTNDSWMFYGIPYLKVFSSCVGNIKLIEIEFTVYGENPLITDGGIFQNTERKSANSIGCYSRDIDRSSHKKPARLDKYSSDQCRLYDTERWFFIFCWSCSAIGKYTFYNGKKHHKSQREVGKVFHHISKLPEWCVEMKNWSVDEGIVQCKSCNDQERPEEEIN